MEDTEKREIDIREYWHVIKKGRWTIISVLIILVSIVTLASFFIEPTYRATARVQVKRENPKILSFEEIYSIDASQQTFYQTQVELIKSRSLAREVIDSLSLNKHPEFSGAGKNNWKKRIKKIFNLGSTNKSKSEIDPLLINAFLKRLVVEPDRNSQIINISFISHNAEMAAYVANEVANHFIESRLEAKYVSAKRAYSFLNKQIKELMNDIADKEREMQKYAQDKEIFALKDDEDIVVKQLTDINTEYTRVKAKRIEKEAMYRSVMNVSVDSIPEVIRNPLIQRLKEEYAGLEREYAEKSKKFKEEYPEMIQLNSKLAQAKQRLDKEVKDIINKVRNSAMAEYQAALKQEQSIKEMLNQQKEKAVILYKDGIIYNNLKVELDNKRALLQELTKRQNEVGVSADIKELGSTYVHIVDKADIPQNIYKPNKKINILLSIVVGLILGIVLAFFFDYLDNSLKNRDDVERYINLPTIGIIPALDGINRSAPYAYDSTKHLGNRREILPKSIEKIVHTHTKSIISEAYGALRTSILLSSANSPPKTILVTSSQPEEGKTATAINIAITLAQLGEKVLLLETDLRRPRIAKIFKIYNKFGISNFLAGNTDDREAIFSTEIPNLSVMPSGPIPPNPAVLLTTTKLDKLLEDWKKSFSFIIMDSPPMLSVTDAQLLASKVDAVMIVVRGGTTPRDLVKLCKERLRGSNIIGVVLNRINLDKHDYYYKHYYYYYSKKSRMHDKKLAIRIGNKR